MKSAKGKILFVDDDQGLLDAMSDFLSLEDYDVDAINDGKKALEMLVSGKYDLLVSDIKMPGISGLELLKKAKEIDNEVPVIIVTGFASLETAISSVREGAYDYLTKPFDMEKFLKIVDNAVKQRRLSRENKDLLNNLVSLDEQLESKLNQIFALGEVSKAITSIADLDMVLQAIVNMSSEITKACKIALLLLDESSKELVVENFKGFDAEILRKLRIKISEGVIGISAQSKKPIVSSQLKAENIVLGKKEKDLFGDGEFLCLPINYRDNVFGVLILTGFPQGHSVTNDEIRVLSILSRQASIAINNSLLYEKLQNKYLATLEVLVSALEAKCKNTKGHSQRVSVYAREFAKYLKLQEQELVILEKACAVHDIGKIVIQESILSKPDVLTAEEMNQMKTHPLKGVDILIPLGIMKEIVPIVRSHHERFDGKGYPDALKDGQIPFESKVVSIVDTFDAMTSHRSYRKRPFTKEECFKEIEAQSSKQFDPDLVVKFLKFNPNITDHSANI